MILFGRRVMRVKLGKRRSHNSEMDGALITVSGGVTRSQQCKET